MARDTESRGGLGIFTIVGVVFITLKLIPDEHGHIIDWSWWWVLSPFWIGGLVVLLIMLGVLAAWLFVRGRGQ